MNTTNSTVISVNTGERRTTFLAPGEMRCHFCQLISVLREKGVPAEIVGLFKVQQETVLNEASKIPLEKGEIPFLMGIPRECLNAEEQARIFGISLSPSFKDLLSLECREFYGSLDIPRRPYFFFGVKNGNENISRPWNMNCDFKEKEIKALSVEELFSLWVQTRVLIHHFIFASPQEPPWDGDLMVPGLSLYGNGEVWLEFYSTKIGYPKWGTPSCRFRKSFL